MSSRVDEWYDDAAGPLIRPYAITRGRIPNTDFDVATQVMAIQTVNDRRGLNPEHVKILELCRTPHSIAELSAYVKVPLAVVKVLCSDLVERGDIIVGPRARVSQSPDRELLEKVLDGLLKL